MTRLSRLGMLALLVASPALAQPAAAPAPPDPSRPTFRPDGAAFRQPTGRTDTAARITSTTGSFATPTVAPIPYIPPYTPGVGYGGIVNFTDPYSGFMNGAANIISAEGQFRIANQQSRVIAEQANQAKYDTRRRAIDEWLYERSVLPSNEDLREQAQWAALRRARNNPPSTEIFSGGALNDLLEGINKVHRTGGPGPVVQLSEEILRAINYTSGETYRGSGLLKDGGELRWPISLLDGTFQAERRKVDELVRKAVSQAGMARIEVDVLRDLNESLEVLEEAVRARAKDLPPTESIQARRYVRELKESCGVFRQPDPARYFAAASRPRATSVGELIDQMNNGGLRFGPAVSGDEVAYRALHQALVTYDARMAQMAARP